MIWLNRLWLNISDQFVTAFITDSRWKYILKGLGNTLLLTALALCLGIVLGVVVSIVRSTWDKRRGEMRPGFGKGLFAFFNALCKVYLTVIRGTPVVVQILIIFFVIMASSSNKILAGVIAFGINSGAYVA